MAKIFYTGIVDHIAGKIAGTVFQKSNGGYQIRSKGSYSQRDSVTQMRTRGIYSYLTFFWSTLLQSERDTWIAADVDGISGKALFMRNNIALLYYGSPVARTFTIQPEFNEPTVLLNTLSSSTFTITFNGLLNPIGANKVVSVYGVPMRSPGTQFTNRLYSRLIAYTPPNTNPNTSFSIFTPYTAKYGALIPGQQVMLYIHLLDVVTGNTGPGTKSTHTIV